MLAQSKIRNPVHKPAFIADCHLGKLAKYLRLLGFDTLYYNQIDDDALLDICIIGKVPNWTRINYVLKMKDGGHRKMNAVSFYKSNKITIEENPALVAHMDGESIGSPPFQIQILPKAVTFRI